MNDEYLTEKEIHKALHQGAMRKRLEGLDPKEAEIYVVYHRREVDDLDEAAKLALTSGWDKEIAYEMHVYSKMSNWYAAVLAMNEEQFKRTMELLRGTLADLEMAARKDQKVN